MNIKMFGVLTMMEHNFPVKENLVIQEIVEFNGQLTKMLQTQLYNGMQDKRTSGLSIYKYDES